MTVWADRIASRANSPTQPDTSHYTLAAQNAEIDPTEQDYSPYAVVARRQAQRGLPVTPAPESYVPKVIGPAWTPPPGWVHSGNGWNPPGTPEGVRTPMPAGYETYRRDGSSTNTPYAPGTTSQAYNLAQIARGGSAAPRPVSIGGVASSPFQISPQQIGNILSNQIQQQNPMGNVRYEPRMQQPLPQNNWARNINGRPVGSEFAHGTQMNPIMSGMRNEIRQPVSMQQAIGQGAQQNQQQQLMALLSLLFNRG